MRLRSLVKATTKAQEAIVQEGSKVKQITWVPRENNPQSIAYELIRSGGCKEILFGGRAGSGKSEVLLGSAFTLHRRSIIYRREYPQLQGLIDRSTKLVGDRRLYNKTEKKWSLGDRAVRFGAVQYEDDAEKFQGQEFDFIGFDEVTHFTRSQYLFLTGWNRTTVPGQHCCIVATCNPPTTEEGTWIIDHWGAWLDDKYSERTGRSQAASGEIRYFAMIDGEEIEVDDETPIDHNGETIIPSSRTFISGEMVQDLVETGYRQNLMRLEEPLRSLLLYGNFNLKPASDPWQVIFGEWVDAAMDRYVSYQPYYKVTDVGCDVARGGQDQTVIALLWNHQVTPLIIVPGGDTPSGKEFVKVLADNLPMGHYNEAINIKIDATGVGSSALDFTRDRFGRANYPHKIIAFTGANGAKIDDEPLTDQAGMMIFNNMRSYAYWRMRELLHPDNNYKIALPPDKELKAELCAPRYSVQPGITFRDSRNHEDKTCQKIVVESKESVVKKLGRSPDRADAVILAFVDKIASEKGAWLRKIALDLS